MRRIFLYLAFAAILVPNFASAVIGSASDRGQGSDDPAAFSNFQLVSCAGVDDPRTTDKREVECTYEQLVATASRIIKFVLYLLTPILLFMILIMGFKYITANGDSGKLMSAKKMFVPVLLGVFFIFAGWIIVYTILDKFLAVKIGDIEKSSIIPSRAN